MSTVKFTPRTTRALPEPSRIQNAWKAAAMYEALIQPDTNWRVVRFFARRLAGVDVGWIDSRQGDCIKAAFCPQGTIIHGYNSGSPLAAMAKVLIDAELSGRDSAVPAGLRRLLKLDSLDCGGMTFCLWRTRRDHTWRIPEVLVSSPAIASYPFEMLEIVAGGVECFVAWVEEYYERLPAPDVITRIFALDPLTSELASLVGATCVFAEACERAKEIGYPLGKE